MIDYVFVGGGEKMGLESGNIPSKKPVEQPIIYIFGIISLALCFFSFSRGGVFFFRKKNFDFDLI